MTYLVVVTTPGEEWPGGRGELEQQQQKKENGKEPMTRS